MISSVWGNKHLVEICVFIAGEAAKVEADAGFRVQCQFTQDAQNSHLIGCETESEKQPVEWMVVVRKYR